MSLVSKTLEQCLQASSTMTWDHNYPNLDKKVDEYSLQYINNRKKREKEWASSSLLEKYSSQLFHTTLSSTNDTSDPNQNGKRHHEQSIDPPAKRQYATHSFILHYRSTNYLGDESHERQLRPNRVEQPQPPTSSYVVPFPTTAQQNSEEHPQQTTSLVISGFITKN